MTGCGYFKPFHANLLHVFIHGKVQPDRFSLSDVLYFGQAFPCWEEELSEETGSKGMIHNGIRLCYAILVIGQMLFLYTAVDTHRIISMRVLKKDALLKAAKEIFGEYGYSEATLKKIAERAGAASGLAAHHFGTKEQIFLAVGLDVLKHFLAHLRERTESASDGRDAVLRFCRAYLEFALDKDSGWLVLVRCSPFSDMKIIANCDTMNDMFIQVPELLESLLEWGVRDGSLNVFDCKSVAQVIIALMVGANRTLVLTPYAAPALENDVLRFVDKALNGTL